MKWNKKDTKLAPEDHLSKFELFDVVNLKLIDWYAIKKLLGSGKSFSDGWSMWPEIWIQVLTTVQKCF